MLREKSMKDRWRQAGRRKWEEKCSQARVWKVLYAFSQRNEKPDWFVRGQPFQSGLLRRVCLVILNRRIPSSPSPIWAPSAGQSGNCGFLYQHSGPWEDLTELQSVGTETLLVDMCGFLASPYPFTVSSNSLQCLWGSHPPLPSVPVGFVALTVPPHHPHSRYSVWSKFGTGTKHHFLLWSLTGSGTGA